MVVFLIPLALPPSSDGYEYDNSVEMRKSAQSGTGREWMHRRLLHNHPAASRNKQRSDFRLHKFRPLLCIPAAKTRAEGLHVIFFSTKHPSQARRPTASGCFCSVYSRLIRSHQRRVGCATPLGLWVRARVDRQLAVVWLRRGAATALAHRGGVRSPTHRSLLALMCVPRTAAVPGSAQLDFS